MFFLRFVFNYLISFLHNSFFFFINNTFFNFPFQCVLSFLNPYFLSLIIFYMFTYVLDLEFTVQYIHQQSANPLKLYSPHLCPVLKLPICLLSIFLYHHNLSHFLSLPTFLFCSLFIRFLFFTYCSFCLNFFMAGFLISGIRAYQGWKRENGEYLLQIIEHTHACALACSCDLYLINRSPYVLTQTWTYFLLTPNDYLLYEKVSAFQKRKRDMYIHIPISFCVHVCKTFFSITI